ncbi:hypothetical protein P8C59_005722 [Phyllachora maydis]|uniref:Pathway-specific nitrogen regulator n=1 Tax=Phyllachora maydis TaxID=1825666 RepID=A0AAD9I4Z3_9PEZI|nr:hypothetical protein P8C59_005722 [Phyllachora maydis]
MEHGDEVKQLLEHSSKDAASAEEICIPGSASLARPTEEAGREQRGEKGDAHSHDEDHADDEEDSDDDDTPRPISRGAPVEDEGGGTEESPSRPGSTASSLRRTSLRTEALIHAAARAVVVEMGKQRGGGVRGEDEGDHHTPPAAAASVSGDEAGDSSSHHENDDDVFSERSNRTSVGSFDGVVQDKETAAGQDDTPSPKSPTPSSSVAFQCSESRTSARSSPRVSGISDMSGLSRYETFMDDHDNHDDDHDDDFVLRKPTTSRIPFRSPSSVRALQMASPTPSVFDGSSPRTSTNYSPSKRPSHHHYHGSHSHSPFPTVSRLGSPAPSPQYSPKGRATPPRFKRPPEAAPLVLLHVTLLPLRWPWGDVLNAAASSSLSSSEPLRTLRDAWRALQDRCGDTVRERGVLLPHPQGDYEVLEERLLEALELPLRRRARILECGHYLGPANMDDDYETETSGSEDEDEDGGEQAGSRRASSADRKERENKRHWCGTCRGEIRFESLGAGPVFRVKVYASNGLIRAGAWAACWKEMERVDVELEPLMDPALQTELEVLAAAQAQPQQQQQTLGHLLEEPARDSPGDSSIVTTIRHVMPSSPPAGITLLRNQTLHASPLVPPSSSPVGLSSSPPIALSPPRAPTAEPIDTSAARQARDAERLREIYGDPADGAHTPLIAALPAQDPTSSMHAEPTITHPQSATALPSPATPRSPCEEVHERRRQHHHRGGSSSSHSRAGDGGGGDDDITGRGPYQGASLAELLWEVGRVLLRDPKNVAMVVMGLVVLALVVGRGSGTPGVPEVIKAQDPIVPVAQVDMQQQQAIPVPSVATASSLPLLAVASAVSDATAAAVDPCETQRPAGHAGAGPHSLPAADPVTTTTEKTIVRIVETLTEIQTQTETATVKVRVTSTATEVEQVTITPGPPLRVAVDGLDGIGGVLVVEGRAEEEIEEVDCDLYDIPIRHAVMPS